MGSIAYAVGGALAGGGQGAAQVGAEVMKQQHDEGLLRLQKEWQESLQGKGFEQQTKMQEKGQEFEKGLKEEELQAHGRIAGAEMAQKSQLAGQSEAAALERTKVRGQYLVEARKAGVAGRGAAAPQKTWTAGHYQLQGGIDPTTHMPVPGATVPVMQHRDGRIFVQAGDKFMLYDATKGNQLPDVKSVRNAPARAVQELTNDPNGSTPDGSQTKADAFQDAYHYLPSSYFSAAQRAEQQGQGTGGGPLGKAAPPNSTFVPGQSFGGNEPQATAEENDYANTGDEGPQESDNTPAQ